MSDAAEQRSESQTGNNRYILLATLGAVALITIYIVKTNLEPSSADRAMATQDANSRIDGVSDSLVNAAMHAELEEQVGHIRDVLKRDSTNVDAWVALGNLYYDASMPDESIAHYRRALELRPGDLNIMTDLATMLRAQGHPDSALALLNHVVATDSTRAQAWFNLGVIQSFDLKNQREALLSWKRFLAISPQSEHTEAVRREIERLEKEL